jgi:uncharacterized protein (TIGR03086 family)
MRINKEELAVAVALDRRAVERSVDVVAAVRVGDLARPTPCEGWALVDLLAHMTAQHRGFAAAARGERTVGADWAPRRPGPDPAGEYATAARAVVAAFADLAERTPDVELWLPEIRGGVHLAAPIAVGFHLVDYAVHAWDVAASLGVAVHTDPDVLAAAIVVAEQVPDDGSRQVPGAAFRPALAATVRDNPEDRLLRLLGRDPAWAPPTPD